MRQRSEEQGCGCGCWCSGAVWVDGWAAFGAFPTAGALTIAAFVTAGDAWMLALRESFEWVCVGVLMANMMVSMHLCARARMYTLQSRHVGDLSSKMGTLLSRVATYPPGARRRAGASGGRAIDIAAATGAATAEAQFTPKTATDRSRAVLCTTDDSRPGVLEFSQVSALLCIFTEPELARLPTEYDQRAVPR